MNKLRNNEARNLVVVIEGTCLHHELALHDPAALRQRIENLLDDLRNSPALRDTDVASRDETIACLYAAGEEMAALSDELLRQEVEKCIGNTMPPEIKKFIEEKRSRALTTIIQASLGLGL